MLPENNTPVNKEVRTGFESSPVVVVIRSTLLCIWWCGEIFSDQALASLSPCLSILVSALSWCVPGCPEGAEERQAGMPETGTVQNAVRLGSEVRENSLCS